MSSSSIVKSVHGRQYREYRGSAADLYTTIDYWLLRTSPLPTFPLSDGWWPPSKNLFWSLHPAGRSDFRSKSGMERDVLRSSTRSYIVLTLPPSSGRNGEQLQGGLPKWPLGHFRHNKKYLKPFGLQIEIWRLENHFPSKESNCSTSHWNTCVYTKLIGLKVQQASEKALALLQDNLELPLRPIQATKMTTGPF